VSWRLRFNYKKHLDELYNKLGHLPYSNTPMNKEVQNKIFKDDKTTFKKSIEINTHKGSWYRDFCQNGEIQFTNQLFQLGYKLMEIKSDEKVAMWHEHKY